MTSTLRLKPLLTYLSAGLCLLLAALLIWAGSAIAQISYDPYADSVATSSPGVVNADNAVGAPNGTMAQMAGANAILSLDMGAGEDGTQTLRVHFGQINALVNATVAFLDANQNVITSRSVQLGIDPNPSTQNFEYSWVNYGKAYRFVRLSSTQIAAGLNVDAVEALGYIGSTPTQDTDGDGVPDRTEQQSGTNPLVVNPGTSGTPPGAGGSTGGVSGPVNPPPPASNDKDGDGMPDDWEAAHGLNPNDKTDADKDPDHDELDNLAEYQIGSDPQKADTDGDGMPDGWEHKNGLNVNKNDADGDPDGDFLTNLGEYKHKTDPNKADDLKKVFCDDEHKSQVDKISPWYWVLIIVLLLGVLASWITPFRSRFGKTSKSGTDNSNNPSQ